MADAELHVRLECGDAVSGGLVLGLEGEIERWNAEVMKRHAWQEESRAFILELLAPLARELFRLYLLSVLRRRMTILNLNLEEKNHGRSTQEQEGD